MSEADGEPVRYAPLPGGRRMAYRVFGAEDGRPILALHGTPGSRRKFEVADREARDFGLKLISIDRWGYGLSDPHPRPSLVRFGDDLTEFADRTGLDRFAVMGISGGGPFAVAVAAAMPERVTALGLIAPVGPIAGTAVGFDMSPFHILAFRGLSQTPGAIRLGFHAFRAMLGRNSAVAMKIAAARASQVDRRTVCQPREQQSLVEAFRAGLAPGCDGPVVDMRLFGRRWDLDLGAIRARTRMWLGSADRNIPVRSARLLADTIPGCEFIDLTGQGHYWVIQNIPTVLEWFASVDGPSRA